MPITSVRIQPSRNAYRAITFPVAGTYCSNADNLNMELMEAAKTGNLATLNETLLCSGTDIMDGSGRSPLFWAAQNGHSMIVQLLLSCSVLETVKINNEADSAFTKGGLRGSHV